MQLEKKLEIKLGIKTRQISQKRDRKPTLDKHLPSKINHLVKILDEYSHCYQTDNLDIWLNNFFRTNKKYGSNDRRFLRDILYDLLRMHGIYAYMLDPKSTRQVFHSIKTSTCLFEYLNTLDNNQLSEFVDLKAKLENNRTLQKISVKETERLSVVPSTLDLKNPVDLAIATSCPIDTAEMLLESFAHLSSDNLHLKTTYLTKKSRAWIRLTESKNARLIAKEASDNDVVFCEDNGFYYFIQSPKIKNFKTYRAGLFEFQDLASQHLVVSNDPSFTPENIWDVCAGGGGKTLQLRLLYPSASILASDIRAHSLENLKQRSKKSRLKNIYTLCHDATQPLVTNKSFENGSKSEFDLIVIDAPCSSSGTLRRSPDQKLRLTKGALGHYTSLQTKILETSSKNLTSGGRLIYSTCSMFREENEDIIERFMNTAKDFSLISTENFAPPEYDCDFMFKAELQKI